MPNRAGFTLVEVLVAVLLLDVGLLALVAGSVVIVRETNELSARTAAAHAAENRLQQLGSGSCVASTGSAIVQHDMQESWRVSLAGIATREISDSVTFALGAGTRAVVLRTRLPC